MSLSDTVRVLKERGLVETAVAVAPCLDGDVQCVSTASALAWARAAGFDAVVCAIGPGIVGTGTRLGHGGLAAAEAANAAAALGGRPVVAARVSDGDPRERHRGVSHHTRAVLGLCLGEVDVAWPIGLERCAGRASAVDVDGWQRGLRRPAALAHGPRAGRRPVVLRRRVRRRPARARRSR